MVGVGLAVAVVELNVDSKGLLVVSLGLRPLSLLPRYHPQLIMRSCLVLPTFFFR